MNNTTDEEDFISGDGVCETAPGNGVCTLRAAIEEANALLPGPHTITLPSGTYTLTLGHLEIHADLTIKERALARTAPASVSPGRYRAADPLLAFLEGL